MKRYIFVLLMLALVAFSFAACGGDDDDTTAASTTTAATTTTEKLTETQPAGVKIGDVAAADDPVDRFADHPALLLWEDPAEIPGNEDGSVTPPTIVPYLSAENKGVIVLFQGTAPEGGYYISEGAPVAEYLSEMGYDVFVCKYRLTDSYTDCVVLDADRAVQFVRYYASEFGVADKKIATLGFGTGALLAYIQNCDAQNGAATVNGIGDVNARGDMTLMFNPDLTPDAGMFVDAAPLYGIVRSRKFGIYYEATAPNVTEILTFAFDLRHEDALAFAEVHSIYPDAPYKAGGDRTENYATLYEMMANYLKAYGF